MWEIGKSWSLCSMVSHAANEMNEGALSLIHRYETISKIYWQIGKKEDLEQ